MTFTDQQAAERLLNRLSREVAAAIERGDGARAKALANGPVTIYLGMIAQGEDYLDQLAAEYKAIMDR